MTVRKILDNAISKKQTISFTYEEINRTVEPHHYGVLNSTQQLHAYQISGDSKSGALPEWRNFKLEKIENLVLNNKVFHPRASYNPSNSGYQIITKKIHLNPDELNKTSPRLKIIL